MKSPRPDIEVPQEHRERRGELWTEHRRRRATYLHQLLSLVPAEQQPEALAYALEIERIDGEAVRENAGAWLQSVQHAYRTGIVHGGEDMARTLGMIAPEKADEDEAPPIQH